MAISNCTVCQNDFYIKPNRLLKGWGKFCSKKCQYKSQFTGEFSVCTTCSKSVYRAKSTLERSTSGKFFCNKSCQSIWRNRQYAGNKHANWTNGQSSYRDALKRSEINLICSKCTTQDSRILAVHHRDRDRTNNSLENLIWLCHNCHYLVHHFTKEAVGFLDG